MSLWSSEDDEHLLQHWGSKTAHQIGGRLGRTAHAVNARALRLGLGPAGVGVMRRHQLSPGMLAIAAKVYGIQGAAELHNVDPETVAEAMARQ